MQSVVKTAKTVDEAVLAALTELACSRDEVEVEVIDEGKSGFLGFGSKEARVQVTRIHQNSETPAPVFEAQERVDDSASHVERKREDVLYEGEVSPSNESESDENEQETHEDLFISKEAYTGLEDVDVHVSKPIEEPALHSPQEIETFCEQWLSHLLTQMHVEGTVLVEAEDDNVYLEIVDISDIDMGIIIGRRAETIDALQYLLSIALNRLTSTHYRIFLDVGGYRARRRAAIERMALRQAEKAVRTARPVRLESMNAYERRIVHMVLQSVDGVETFSERRDPHRRVVIQPVH